MMRVTNSALRTTRRRRERGEQESHSARPGPEFPFRHSHHPARVMTVTNHVSFYVPTTYAIAPRRLSSPCNRPHLAQSAFPGDHLVRKGGSSQMLATGGRAMGSGGTSHPPRFTALPKDLERPQLRRFGRARGRGSFSPPARGVAAIL